MSSLVQPASISKRNSITLAIKMRLGVLAAISSISDVLVEPIDVPSLLFYSVNASEREVNTLRGVVDGLVAATPRLHAQAEAVRARTRIAVRVQRAWRRRRRVYEAA